MDVMNKFPEDFDESILVGRTLEMICIAAYQIMFHFNGKILISVFTTFNYKKPSDNVAREICVPITQFDLTLLLERRISRASLEERHILILEFDSGHVLRFSDT